MATIKDDPIPVSAVADTELQDALMAWFQQRGDSDLPPTVDQLDPFVVPALASSAILYDVSQDLSLTMKIAGDEVRTLLGYNPAGETIEEIVGTGPYGRFIISQLQGCAEKGLPLFAHHDYVSEQRERSRQSVRVALPYRDGGRVCKLLCFQKFSDYIEYHRISVPGDDAWSAAKLAFVDRV